MLALYASRRGKRGSVGFTTSLAVAMHNGHIHRVYFVTYLTTQTASLQPHEGISFCTFNEAKRRPVRGVRWRPQAGTNLIGLLNEAATRQRRKSSVLS